MERLAYGEFRGEILGECDLPGFRLCETIHGGSERITPHLHETPYFCLVLRGGFEEFSDLGTRACGPGMALLHTADDPHADSMLPSGAVCLNVQLGPEWREWAKPGLDSPLVSFGSNLAWAATRVASAYRRSRVTPDLLAALMAAAKPPGARSNDGRIALARKLIRSRLREPLALPAIADRLGMHPVYLARRFRSVTGLSCGEYLARVRTQLGARMLAATAAPLAEIAVECGFFDQSHFTNTFRKTTGLTPGNYRACYRQNPVDDSCRRASHPR